MTRKLTDRQAHTLAALQRHQGRWYQGCGWKYDTDSGTAEIMRALIRKGYAEMAQWEGRAVCRITHAGNAAVAALAASTGGRTPAGGLDMGGRPTKPGERRWARLTEDQRAAIHKAAADMGFDSEADMIGAFAAMHAENLLAAQGQAV